MCKNNEGGKYIHCFVLQIKHIADEFLEVVLWHKFFLCLIRSGVVHCIDELLALHSLRTRNNSL